MISRRDLLFGMVRRARENEGSVRPVSGIGADITAADAAFVRREYESARDLYKAVLKDNRNHKEARIRLGMCHYRLEEYVQAKDVLLMVVKAHPAEYLAKLYLGLAYARREQVQKCMDAWDGFIDREHVGVMREINVFRALHDSGEMLSGAEIAAAVEKVLG